jgi:NADPH-dependent 2,4-dienoyl-CoA reductase/sulfur reductase-like enzyme
MNRIGAVSALQDAYDLIVVGAGPAGLAAAATASELGVSVLLADENPTPGGQIYRSITTTPVQRRTVLGADYWRGKDLVDRFAHSPADYVPRTTVWTVGRTELLAGGQGFEVGVSVGGQARLIDAKHVILATGALERPMPIPGWTLPGVMTAGAAQIALKSSGVVPDGRVVLAGCGPLLYLLASQLQAAGANIVAVLDTSERANIAAAASALPDFLLSPYLAKGLKLMLAARRKLRFLGGVTSLRAEGEGEVRRVVAERGGSREIIACDLLLLHQGVIPNVNMTSAVGCEQAWDAQQHCWTPKLDDWFGATVPGVSIAGDGGGIGGAESAALRGEVAALEAARRIGRIDHGERDRRAAPVLTALGKAMRGRRFLDILYRPATAFLAPPDADTVVCRCEEVTAGQLRDATRKLGVQGPNQMKTFLRCGMGPCQGRLCGPTVTEIIAEERGVSPADVGYYRLRPPVKPVTLGELANLPKSDAAVKAVCR